MGFGHDWLEIGTSGDRESTIDELSRHWRSILGNRPQRTQDTLFEEPYDRLLKLLNQIHRIHVF